jgi:branched-chain amino acid transport system permease protein
MMKKKRGFLALGVVVGALLLILLPFMTPYKALASQMLIFAIFAIGFDIVFGYTGLLSFGHAAFFGTGAYATGLMLIHFSVSAPLGLLVGILASFLLSIPIGFLSIRKSGIYFAMVTLAFGQVVYFVAFKWRGLTGGDDGLHGVPRVAFGPLDLSSELVFYYFILFFFLVSVCTAVRIINSPFGKTLQALRENEKRAKSVGYNPSSYKLTSFVVSACFAGLAGGLYALLQNFVPLYSLNMDTSGDIVLMTLIGGMGTLYGPVMGAMSIVLFKDLLSTYLNIWPMMLGLLFVVSVMTFRKGVFKEIMDKVLKL